MRCWQCQSRASPDGGMDVSQFADVIDVPDEQLNDTEISLTTKVTLGLIGALTKRDSVHMHLQIIRPSRVICAPGKLLMASAILNSLQVNYCRTWSSHAGLFFACAALLVFFRVLSALLRPFRSAPAKQKRPGKAVAAHLQPRAAQTQSGCECRCTLFRVVVLAYAATCGLCTSGRASQIVSRYLYAATLPEARRWGTASSSW